MGKDVTPPISFENIEPTSRVNQGQDYVRVSSSGLAFSAKASIRLGVKARTMAVQVSSDRKTIKLTEGGAFHVSTRSSKAGSNGQPTLTINSMAIPQKAPIGVYMYQGGDIYVRDDYNA